MAKIEGVKRKDKSTLKLIPNCQIKSKLLQVIPVEF